MKIEKKHAHPIPKTPPQSNPFGSLIKSRSYSAGSGFRFGFNGKEKEGEFSGDAYDFGARIYDGRLGRWMSVDPHFKRYPFCSYYLALGNGPIITIDPDGKDIVYFNNFGIETERIKSKSVFKTYIQSTTIIKKPSVSLKGWKEVPMPRIIQMRTQSNEKVSSVEYQENDYIIAARTGLFNQTKNNGKLILYTDGGHLIPQKAIEYMKDLDPTRVKAMAIQESHNGVNGGLDILTVNNTGDYGKYKAAYGLNKSEKVDVNRSLYLGIRFLASKGFKNGVDYDSKTGETIYKFQDWDSATKYYNYPGVKKYELYIKTMIVNSKTPTSSSY